MTDEEIEAAEVEMRFWMFKQTNRKLPMEERILDAELAIDWILNGNTSDDDGDDVVELDDDHPEDVVLN